MAATNPDSVGNQPFHARAPTEHNKPIAEQINSGPRDQPLDPHAHHPGVLVGNERIPEYHAETLPAGSAPEERTFAPNTAFRDDAVDEESTATSAADSLGGATSADVNKGLGKPMQGETSREERHERKRQGHGVMGVGAEGEILEP